jgi:hypothetical protein
MNVRQLSEWLSTFPDQDAEIDVVQNSRGSGYYNQGGYAKIVKFDPQFHLEYTDLRKNQFFPAEHPRKNMRTLLLGEIDA